MKNLCPGVGNLGKNLGPGVGNLAKVFGPGVPNPHPCPGGIGGAKNWTAHYISGPSIEGSIISQCTKDLDGSMTQAKEKQTMQFMVGIICSFFLLLWGKWILIGQNDKTYFEVCFMNILFIYFSKQNGVLCSRRFLSFVSWKNFICEFLKTKERHGKTCVCLQRWRIHFWKKADTSCDRRFSYGT